MKPNDVTVVIPSIGRNNDLDETVKFLNQEMISLNKL